MNRRRLVLVVLPLLALPFLAFLLFADPSSGPKERFARIAKGMSQDEVEQIVGDSGSIVMAFSTGGLVAKTIRYQLQDWTGREVAANVYYFKDEVSSEPTVEVESTRLFFVRLKKRVSL
jgi:CYTH domain-containing protein